LEKEAVRNKKDTFQKMQMDVVLFSMSAMNFCQDYRKKRPRNLNLKTS